MDIEKQKAQLRAALRRQAAGLPSGYLAASDERIYERLVHLPQFLAAQTVFCYVSIGAEPDTRRLLEKALALGKTVCVPRCEGAGQMHARRIESLSALAPGYCNLQEPPVTAPVVPPDKIDLAVVPCVAADKAGYRLGNGGGYYDRYLPVLGGMAVCLCRGRLLQSRLPRTLHDVPIDTVITEEGCWENPLAKTEI